jgi:hypothetical protein
VLNFYQQRPIFALKIHPRPLRPKRPMKVKKGHQRPELQNIIDFINIQCKIINKWECNTVKLGNKERFDKEQIGIKEPFPVTNLPFTS